MFLFIEMYNIEIDQQLKEKYLKYEKASYDSLISNLNQKNKTIVSSVIETIIEEDESIKSITHRTEKKLIDILMFNSQLLIRRTQNSTKVKAEKFVSWKILRLEIIIWRKITDI